MKDLTQLSTEELQAEMARREAKQKAEREANKRAYEQMKADAAVSLCTIAENLNEKLKEFKTQAFETMGGIYELLQEYSERKEDSKGNFEIEFGNYKVTYKSQGKGVFDERADQAEKHIFDFVNSYFSGDKDTQDFIMSMLERKEGKLDINLIQRLYQMEERFDNPNWKKGIALLKESYQYNHSKDYIRFYEKNQHGEWENISLQFSRV